MKTRFRRVIAGNGASRRAAGQTDWKPPTVAIPVDRRLSEFKRGGYDAETRAQFRAVAYALRRGKGA